MELYYYRKRLRFFLVFLCVFSLTLSFSNVFESRAEGITLSTKVLKADSTVQVKKIKLKDQNISIVVGEQYKILYSVSPSKATNSTITWMSSNTSIATVNNGVVTGIEVGKATITATSENGKTATCEVEVRKATDIAVKDVKLKDKSITINKGEQYKIYVSVNPANAANQTVTWSTSNSSVAAVDNNGIVTGKSKGNATITATTINGKSASCTVNVKGDAEIKKIKLQYSEINISPGKSFKLKVAVSPSSAPNTGISWSSSDNTVASVDSNGIVTAKKKGTATITAKSKNGKTAKCIVKVKNLTIQNTFDVMHDAASAINESEEDAKAGIGYEEVEKIEITSSAPMALGSINMLGKPVQLTAKCYPEDSSQKVIWSSSNSGVVSVSENGTVTPRGYGSAIVTATSINGLNQSVTFTVSKDNRFTKSISHTDDALSYVKTALKILNHDPWGITTIPLESIKWDEYFEIHVDGLTGKIDKNSIVGLPTAKGFRLGVVVGFTDGKIEKAYVGDEYVDFLSRATLTVGIGAGDIKGDFDSKTFVYRYRFYNNGNFSPIN